MKDGMYKKIYHNYRTTYALNRLFNEEIIRERAKIAIQNRREAFNAIHENFALLVSGPAKELHDQPKDSMITYTTVNNASMPIEAKTAKTKKKSIKAKIELTKIEEEEKESDHPSAADQKPTIVKDSTRDQPLKEKKKWDPY